MSSDRPEAVRPVISATPQLRRRRGTAAGLVRSCRPKQWIKNGFVLVPAVFGAAFVARIGPLVLTVVAFCLTSSALYLINDVLDRESDRLHDRTRNRPIASGLVSARTGVVAACVLLAAALVLAALVSIPALIVLLTYAASTLLYSFGLKRIVILDVLILAAGFVLRMLAGAAAAQVPATMWLLLCMTFLALFLGFGKRRYDLLALGDGAADHRRVLGEYTTDLLSQFLMASMICTLVSYSLYVFLSPSAKLHQGMELTIPFANFGIFRYLLVAETKHAGGSPEEILLQDRPLQIAAAGWMLVALLSLYVLPGHFF